MEEEEAHPVLQQKEESKLTKKARGRKAKPSPRPGPLSKLLEHQKERLRALFLDETLDRQPPGSHRGGRDPFLDVDLILSGEESPDAPPWSTGPPTEEPEGHEFQYFDPAPGDLKEEEVKALIHKRIEEFYVEPS